MEGPPEQVRELARTRSAARSARDWPTADRLKAQIESAGWKVIDRGTDFALVPAHPLDVIEGDRVRYGWSGSVPSLLGEAPTRTATIVVPVVRATGSPAPAASGLRAYGSADWQVVAVVDQPGLPAPEADEIVQTAELGHAGALNAGIRRAAGRIVVLIDASVELAGDAITPLVQALDDPMVAAVGGFGLGSSDMRQFAAADAGEVVALEDALLAFRREDFVQRGPIDERFRLPGSAGTWWSLVLRDEEEARPPRRALALELPVVRHAADHASGAEEERLAKRDFYRVLDRFGTRQDLLVPVTG
jgi:hypothetical protein